MKLVSPNQKDYMRWYLWKQEKPMEEIAAREKVAVEAIRRSIDRMEMYRFSGQFETVDIAWNHMLLRLVDEQEQTLKSAMVAEGWRTLQDGSQVPIPDHMTRLEALKVAKEFASTARPKTPGSVVNVQQNAIGNSSSGFNSGMSFEQRLREIKAKRAAGEIMEGHIRMIEAPAAPSQSEMLRAEFDDIGIDLEDGDLDEEEDGEDE